MSKSTVEYAFLLNADGDIRDKDDGVFEWYDNDTRVIFRPNNTLLPGVNYTLYLNNNDNYCRDLAGNSMGGFSYSFLSI